jgi:flagellar motor switch protein FliG
LDAVAEPIITGVGGAKRAADILNTVPGQIETAVMEKIAQANADLAGTIQDLMMTFEILNDVDDRGMQSLLREVPSEKLVVALKGAAPETREKIFKNMSNRAAELMREDLEAKGPVRLSEVEAAQKEIMEVARRMLQEGKIVVRGKGEAFV